MDLINRFNPTTSFCLSPARIWISYVICRGGLLCSVTSDKITGDCSFCFIFFGIDNQSLFKLSVHYVVQLIHYIFPQINNLPEPYGKCSHTDLEYVTGYSQEACKLNCLSKISDQVCGCRHIYMPYSNGRYLVLYVKLFILYADETCTVVLSAG